MSSTIEQSLLQKLTEGLNVEQAHAVKHQQGPALVLAGAGSGKTRVLTHRIAALIAQGVPSDQILALTFTNKAAQEMKGRVQEYLSTFGIEHSQSVMLSTFHSFAAFFLRRYADRVGRSSSFVIYDKDDQLKLLKVVVAQLNISLERDELLDLYEAIEFVKNRGRDISQIDLSFYQGLTQQREIRAKKIAFAYEKALQQADAFDFADLIRIPIKILEDSQILEETRARWPWILVDEFQDTNQAQLMLLQKLCPPDGNLFVVGDEDQSIYSWRGAEIQNILQFHRHFPNRTQFKLQQNYRSSKKILDVANRVIAYNHHRIGKQLWTKASPGQDITVYHGESEQDESDYVAHEIKKLIQKGVSYQEIAILYRANHLTLNIETAFQKAQNIPYTIIRGLSFFERAEVKDALAYLRLLINPRDQVAFQRACTTPSRGIGSVSLKHTLNIASDSQVHLFEAALRACQQGLIKGKAKKGFQTLYELYTQGGYLQKQLMSEQAETLLTEAGVYIPHKLTDTHDETRRSQMENIQRLLEHIHEYTEHSKSCTWADYFEKINLVDTSTQDTQSTGSVSLMTVHACKGLEFPYVFVVGLEDGLFPHQRRQNKSHSQSALDLEEERRLFYVAVTRAEKQLWITYAGRRGIFGQSTKQDPSPFLREIEGAFVQHTYASRLNHWKRHRKTVQMSVQRKVSTHHSSHTQTQAIRKTSSHTHASATQTKTQDHSPLQTQKVSVNSHTFYTGQFVQHKTFGMGKVLSISRRSGRYHAQVQFKGRTRNILLDFLVPQ